ncbi:MAG: hypothetical protein NVSMB18_36180 [Acetobacteraceae bacterium]
MDEPEHNPELPALRRLLAIAQSDTGQSRRVADFLLAWWNAQACGGFDLTALWSVEAPILDDMMTVMTMIARDREFPTAYGLGGEFELLVQRWRPGLVLAPR